MNSRTTAVPVPATPPAARRGAPPPPGWGARSRWAGPAGAGLALLAGILALSGCTGPEASPGSVPPLTGSPTSPSGTTPSGPAGGSGPGSGGASVPAGLPAGGPVPAGFTVTSITRVAGGVTYALGSAPCTARPCTSVVRSTDGGRTWRGVPAPRVPLPAAPESRDPGTGAVRELRFATARDGWAFGGGLWSTHDGAASWRKVDAGGSVLDLATDGTTAYALVATCPPDGSSCGGTRLLSAAATGDAFRTVAGVSLPATGYGTVSVGAAGAVVSVSGGTYVAPKGGGWHRADPRCPDAPAAEVLAAAGDAAVVAFCGGVAAGSSYFTVRRSADGGRTWTTVPGRAVQVPNGLLTFTAASSDVLAIASASRDLRGGLKVSGDGGRTWSAASLPATPAGWRYVGASGARTLVALAEPAQPAYWTSGDGGRTWSRTAVR
ncbi:MAG TPA: hypothetical protein VF109_08495 [Mycobacteriales bacterium]